MSMSAFRRAFESIMETTPGAYITTIRINKARKLLSESNKTISDIAEECGFYDQSHFTKIFKRMRGITPGGYRRRRRHTPQPSPHPHQNQLLPVLPAYH